MAKRVSLPKLRDLKESLHAEGSPERAKILQGFFKTGPGEYGEGDRFIGVTVPIVRNLVREYRELNVLDVLVLLKSPIHEERLLALLLLVAKYQRGDDGLREEIYQVYLAHMKWINNWDLIDSSAEHIVGAHLEDRDRGLLDEFARSPRIWDRRVAVIATFGYIKKGKFKDTLRIAAVLLGDEEDLIHKAVGWMLREIGKRDLATLERFLARHYRKMPRTMLRYAIEKFPEKRRQAYLKGTI